MSQDADKNPSDLRLVSTQWSQLADVRAFVLRYVDPIRKYLARLIDDPNDVEDVLQHFLLKVMERGFDRADPDRGRFRHYLIRAVRNEATSFQRSKQRRVHREQPLADVDSAEDPTGSEFDQWDRDWQTLLIDRAWQALLAHQESKPSNFAFDVLQTSLSMPNLGSDRLAREATRRTGHPFTASSFRKQLSRARSQFGKFVIAEVRATLDDPAASDLQTELRTLGLSSWADEIGETSD